MFHVNGKTYKTIIKSYMFFVYYNINNKIAYK